MADLDAADAARRRGDAGRRHRARSATTSAGRLRATSRCSPTAGHGSEEPAPPEIADLEPTGRIQTLMLHDCDRRVDGELRRALADKELSLLIAEVAADGPHVVVDPRLLPLRRRHPRPVRPAAGLDP